MMNLTCVIEKLILSFFFSSFFRGELSLFSALFLEKQGGGIIMPQLKGPERVCFYIIFCLYFVLFCFIIFFSFFPSLVLIFFFFLEKTMKYYLKPQEWITIKNEGEMKETSVEETKDISTL